jgi:hypothetical protein
MKIMKKYSWLGLPVLIAILSIILSGCTKWRYSYIEKYLGSWEFQFYNYTHNVTLDIESWDTIYYTGVITHGSGDNEVLIQYTETNNMTLEVGKDGVILDYCWAPSHCSGKFEDKNTFHYSYSARISTGKYLMIYGKEIYGIRY